MARLHLAVKNIPWNSPAFEPFEIFLSSQTHWPFNRVQTYSTLISDQTSNLILGSSAGEVVTMTASAPKVEAQRHEEVISRLF